MHTVIDGNNFKDRTPHANDLYLFPHISVIPRPCTVPWVHKCVLRRPLFTPLKYHISDNLRQNILGQVSFVYFSTTKLNALPLPLNQCWEYGFCKYFNWNICAEHLALNKYCIAISQHWFGGWGENPALYCQKNMVKWICPNINDVGCRIISIERVPSLCFNKDTHNKSDDELLRWWL